MQRFPRLVSLCLIGLCVLFTACSSSSKKDYPVTAPRFLIEARNEDAGVNLRLPVSGVVVRTSPKVMITEYDVVNATVVETDLGPCVMFRLTPQAGRDLFRLTAINVGSRLVTTINGIPLGVRLLERPIGDSVIITYLEVKPEALPEVVENINKTCADMQKEIAKK